MKVHLFVLPLTQMHLDNSCRPNTVNKFINPMFFLQVWVMLDIKKADTYFISYLSLPMPTLESQTTLVPYGCQCTYASCTLPTFNYLYQNVLDHVMHLTDSFNKWVKDRSLPVNHLIQLALALLPLMAFIAWISMRLTWPCYLNIIQHWVTPQTGWNT